MRLFAGVTTKITLLLVVFSTSFSNNTYSELPNLAATIDERALSNPSYVVGQHWFRKLNGSDSVINFPPAYDYLKDTLSQILPQTSLYNKTIEMTLLNSTQANAFVIPGNHLFIYSDIMEMITSQDMFYGLLAHEVSHLDLNHYERQNQHSSNELTKNMILVGAGIAAALAGADPDASAALWISGMANQVDGALTYSRVQEREADRNGKRYLEEAGLNPQGMTDLFQALAKASSSRPELEFLSSHPLPQSRLADSLSAKTPQSILKNIGNNDFDYFRVTLITYRVMLDDNPYEYLAQMLPQSEISDYAFALLNYLDNSPQKALDYLAKLKQHNRFTKYLLAVTLRADNKIDKALSVTQSILDLAPKDKVFGAFYSELTQTKPNLSAGGYLYENKLLWHAKMDYYQHINDIPLALNYKAKIEFSQGKDKQAMNLLMRAKRGVSVEDKREITQTEQYFDNINEAEKEADIDDNE